MKGRKSHDRDAVLWAIMLKPSTLATLAVLISMTTGSAAEVDASIPLARAGNPILPGYFADPSLVTLDGRHFLYATIDPWGGDRLGCWESSDFRNWTYRALNWPTKKDCTSPTSLENMVWAPSVIRGTNGKFYMYVSVGSEIWAGVASHPLGPWQDANGGKPLVPEKFRPGFHMIDAEVFMDDDGKAYLYWGSGWNWVNGRCWAVRLKADMVTFDGEVRDVTPARYFEAPFMVKHGGRYHLMYSSGKTIEDTYQVHHAAGDSPLGPFEESASSPCLVTDAARNILSPGHHAVFGKDGRHYILYHRHSIPFDPEFIGRQICVDELRFAADGSIEKVVPTHDGPGIVRRETGGEDGKALSASSQRAPHNAAAMVADDNHATLWAAAKGVSEAWIQVDLGRKQSVTRQEIRFEYPWKNYQFLIEISPDGHTWATLVDHREAGVSGSPVVVDSPAEARFIKISFPALEKNTHPGIFEWTVR